MNKKPMRESRETRSQNGALAMQRSRVCTGPMAPASAPRPRLAARLYALFLQGIKQFGGRLRKQGRRRRKLQLLEMQQLGEKRFVAIVRVGKQKFLIGGAATSVSLLAEIHAHRATVIAPRPLGQESA